MYRFFFASSFRIPAGNVLAALGKVKINLYIAFFTGIINLILDLILIKNYGGIGASITSTFIFFLSAIAGNIILLGYLNKKIISISVK